MKPMLRLSRRTLLATPVSLSLTLPERPIEPGMRLANPPADRLTVALTFDACSGAFDERIVEALVAYRIPATIFATGIWLQHNPAGVAALLSHGDLFTIQNHGALHIPPVLGIGSLFRISVAGDLATVRREVIDGATAIVNAGSPAPRWYRAAAGYYSPSAITEIERLGLGIAGYSYSADAGASLPAGRVARRMAGAANGAIIVAHINQPGRPSGAGVAVGLRELKRRGANFLRFDQLTPADLTSIAARGALTVSGMLIS